MTDKRVIRVTSTALGAKVLVYVHVHESLEAMRAEAKAYNGSDNSEALGVTQVQADATGRVGTVIVRLWRERLSTEIVVHEMHHASTAWYGAFLGDRISRNAHLNHYNEPFAHLHSDLVARLVDRLHALGYYAP